MRTPEREKQHNPNLKAGSQRRSEEEQTNPKQFRDELFVNTMDDPEVLEIAFKLAIEGAADDERVTEMDVFAAGPYLRACIARMSDYETELLTVQKAASLLARGTLGAMRWRNRGRKGRGTT